MKLVPSNCPEHKSQTGKKNISREQYRNLNDLVSAMKNPKTGIPVKDRKKKLKTYNNCFVASEAINWLLQNCPIRDREEAEQLGNKLVQQKYIRHAGTPNKPFKDGEHFFIFLVRVPSEVNDVAGGRTEPCSSPRSS